MYQDLTPAFLAALAAPIPWDLKRIGAHLIEVGTRLGMQFYWDGGVGCIGWSSGIMQQIVMGQSG